MLGVAANHVFHFLGQEASCWHAVPRRSRKLFPKSAWRRWSAGEGINRLAPATIGVISNWPISRPKNRNSAHQGLWTRGLADPSSYRRRRSRLLHHLVSSRNIHRNAGGGRRPSGGQSRIVFEIKREKRVQPDSITTSSRSWHGWHRHVSWSCSPSPMMAAIRHRANPPPPKKTKRQTTTKTNASPRHH